jgi:lipoate---protein ligase
MLNSMWHVETSRGDAGEFHRRELPSDLVPTLWWFEVESPALVLGSSQPLEQIDLGACEREGITVVRRRSGGGAVLLHPDESLWVDVLVPRGDWRWTDDVGESALWLGEAWTSALRSVGVDGAAVHRGPMKKSQWSGHVCFAGVAAGEVVLDDRKVVGISQRRNRDGARFQCVVYRRWDPVEHARLFSPPGPTALDLKGLTTTVDRSAAELRTALTDVLDAR